MLRIPSLDDIAEDDAEYEDVVPFDGFTAAIWEQ